MDYPLYNYEARHEHAEACKGGFFCYGAGLLLVVITVDTIRSLHEQGWSPWLLLPGAAIVLSVIGLAGYLVWVLTRALLRRR
jgi:amino acid permease